MKTLNCEYCNKDFNAENVQDFEKQRDADVHPCGTFWSITYLEGGVVHYREIDDHLPNQGYTNACYECKPHYKDEGC